MNARHIFIMSTTLAFAVLSGCGSSSGEGAKSADDVTSDSMGNDAKPDDKPADTGPANDKVEMPHGAKSTSDNSGSSDYELTQRDCIELAKQYKTVQKADQMLNLSPKLSADQRAQGEKAIDDAVAVLAERWESGCLQSLVGGVVERDRLKCAMSSKSVKAFDDCINSQEAPK